MKRKEKHTFYNFEFKHTAVTITNHPNIQSIGVGALGSQINYQLLVLKA